MTTDTTDTYDEVALPHFEDRLSAELAELHAGRRSLGRRRRPSRRTIVVGVAGLAAAATLLAGFGLLPTTGTEPAEASLAERIMHATDDALADSVVHVESDFTNSSDEAYWFDATSGSFRRLLLDGDGNPSYDNGRPTPPAEDAPAVAAPEGEADLPAHDERLVNYCHREYTDTHEGPSDIGDTPADISDRLERGDLVQDGTETVDGRELLRLRDVAVANLPDDFAVEQFVLVDPDTYRPVQINADRGGPEELVMTFEYLPRTAENLAQLSPPVPDGFTRVDELRPCE
jgi:hypothetical protein